MAEEMKGAKQEQELEKWALEICAKAQADRTSTYGLSGRLADMKDKPVRVWIN